MADEEPVAPAAEAVPEGEAGAEPPAAAAEEQPVAEEGAAEAKPAGDPEEAPADVEDKPSGEIRDQQTKEDKPKKGLEGNGENDTKEEKSEVVVTKVSGVKQMFDSKGSLLETQSFVKKKLEEFKVKRSAVAKLIAELQAKVKAYKEKKNPTEADIANLKVYHAEFLEKLKQYDEMTGQLEKLMGMDQKPSDHLPDKHEPDKKSDAEKPKTKEDSLAIEDKLPKVIVCGTDMGDNVPRIIVCEPLRKKDLEPFGKGGVVPTEGKQGDCVNKLNECYTIQQKLAAENAEVQKIRYQQQQQLLEMQDCMDYMKQRMMQLEMDNCRMLAENEELQNQLCNQKPQQMYPPCMPAAGGPKMCKRELYMKHRGQPAESSEPTQANMQNLEDELMKMGGDIATIANDLDSIQKEKMNLGYPSCTKKPVCKLMLPQVATQTDEDKEKDVFFESGKDPKYKDLREQYHRLHSDFKNKVTEVASLRVDNEKTKKELEDITILHHELEAMHQKEVEENNALLGDKNQIQSLKDQIVDLEQQANMAKQMFKSSQEEMEEMRSLIEDQATQLDEYRNKYMKTLQIAEELKKENEFKERECADQIAVEIQRVKLEMQEQLEELSPIKDLLKITQQKLKETEQMHTIALETIADMSQQLEETRAQMEAMKEKLTAAEDHGDLKENLKLSLEAAEKRMSELEHENARLKEVVVQLETNQAAQKDQLEEKSHELLQMQSQLETLREESARQVSRVKERSEMIRKCLQAQIAEMEREVAQCRAATAFANRERDEIRSKLQMEICLLSENFRESQNRIVQLQQHVNYLSASHPTNLIDLVKRDTFCGKL